MRPAIFDTFKWIRHIQLNNNLLTEVQPTSPFLQLESLHLVNNLLALVFVALPGQLPGLALYVLPFDMGDTEAVRALLPIDFALMGVSWLAARLAIRR